MTARITYDSKNIDLTIARDGDEPEYIQHRKQNRASSGKIETINIYGIQEIKFEAFFNQAIYYDLIAWWSWARQGKTFAYAQDSAKTGNTTVDGTANSGQKVIPVTATGDFSVDDICIIRAEDADDEFEIIDIDSISAGVSVTAKENLKFSYVSGDTLRHMLYWPSVKCLQTEFRPTRTGAIDQTATGYYRHRFNFIEAL